MKKKIIVIVGPTAIGKTEYSIRIAKKYRTEIISCDSRQFYKELKIGTAPPNDKQLKEVKHHFIHNLSIHDNYSAGAFEKDAIKKIQEIHKKKDNIILVGGSGLYIDAITVIIIKKPTSPIGTENVAPSSSLEISLKMKYDCIIPRNIPITIPIKVINDDSIKNCALIMLDLKPIALSTPTDCLLSTTALTDNTPIAAIPTTRPNPLNP